MTEFVGMTNVSAEPMSFGEWRIHPKAQKPADELGKLITIRRTIGVDGVVEHDDFEYWVPKDVFDSYYRTAEGHEIGWAILGLRNGCKVARDSWEGRQYLKLVDPYAPHPEDVGNGHDLSKTNPYFKAADNNPAAEGTMLPWIGIVTPENKFVPWVASQEDLLAWDWRIIGR